LPPRSVPEVKSERMEIEPSQRPQVQQDLDKENLEEIFLELKKEAKESEIFVSILQTLMRIITNILDHPLEEKYRKLNMTGNFFKQHFIPYPSSLGLFKVLGFTEAEIDKQTYLILSLSSSAPLEKILDYLQEKQDGASFDPFKSNTFGSSGITNSDLARREGFENYYEKLAKLKAERDVTLNVNILDNHESGPRRQIDSGF